MLAVEPLAAQQPRAKAEVTCRPAGAAMQYECAIRLSDARSGKPLAGISLTVGADMPSMPMAHHVRPAKAQETEPGNYRARIELEMHGDWALQLNLAGPVRDRVVKVLRFEGDRVTEPQR
jgi:hypothetical protein